MSSFNNINMNLDKEKSYFEKMIKDPIKKFGELFDSNSSDIIITEADTSQYEQEEVHEDNDDHIMENNIPEDSTSKNDQDNSNDTHTWVDIVDYPSLSRTDINNQDNSNDTHTWVDDVDYLSLSRTDTNNQSQVIDVETEASTSSAPDKSIMIPSLSLIKQPKGIFNYKDNN